MRYIHDLLRRNLLSEPSTRRAHPQIREVMLPLLAERKQRIPVIFDDIV